MLAIAVKAQKRSNHSSASKTHYQSDNFADKELRCSRKRIAVSCVNFVLPANNFFDKFVALSDGFR